MRRFTPPGTPVMRRILAATALALAASPAWADALVVAADADLEFGHFAASPVLASRVAIGTDGLRTTDNGALLSGAAPQPARFTVRGDAGRGFTATVMAVLADTPGVSLGNLTATCGPGSAFGAGQLSGCRLDGAGQATILVGATLVVDAGQGTTSLNAPSAITVRVSN